MDKLQKIHRLKKEAPQWLCFVSGVSLVFLFALAAALFAASVAQAHSALPGKVGGPAIPAIYPEFTTASLPTHLQDAAYHPGSKPVHRVAGWFRGVASWYGRAFNGRVTANGEVYNMYAMTAATTEFYPQLPLGTRLRVVDTHNGRSVVVRINDRGPLPHGRVLDLSYGAARKLAMVTPGLARVQVYVLRWGSDDYHHG